MKERKAVRSEEDPDKLGGGPRIAIILSHPIQYFCPQFASLNKIQNWKIKVFFGSSAGLDSYTDPGFNQVVQWDKVRLDFPHEFLNGKTCLPTDDKLDAFRLNERLQEYNPDVLIIYGYTQRLQRRALNWGHSHNKVLLFFSDSENRHDRGCIKQAIKRIIIPQIYQKVDGFLTTGDANEDYYLMYGAKAQSLFRAPHPIDRDNFEFFVSNKKKYRKLLRTRLGIPDETLVCSVVAKLIPEKRQKDLILALLELNEMKRNIAVLVIGAGEKEQELKKLAGSVHFSQIIFTGFVQAAELPQYYAATDIYVNPSSCDPHSISVSEAIYMGCPVLISDKCGSYGPSDDVQPGRNGFVYSCGNVNELAKYIRTLGNDSDLLQRFSLASREIAVGAQQLSHGEGLKIALTSLGIC